MSATVAARVNFKALVLGALSLPGVQNLPALDRRTAATRGRGLSAGRKEAGGCERRDGFLLGRRAAGAATGVAPIPRHATREASRLRAMPGREEQEAMGERRG